MTRKVKTLGLALFAVLATSAVVASAALANFTAASYPVTYSGSQAATEPHTFKTDGYETTCKNAEFSGEAGIPSSWLILKPTFSECTSAGLSATIDVNFCEYRITQWTPTGSDYDGLLGQECGPLTPGITITAGFGACVIHIPDFSLKSNVTLNNQHPNIRVEANVTGITAQLTDVSPFFCPFEGNTTVNDASYTGNLTISGGKTTIDIG